MDYSTYNSPLSWRYGSSPMRRIFSEKHKYELWRKIWVALAKAHHKAGLVSQSELNDLIGKESNIDIEKILEIEKQTGHDVVAAIREFALTAKKGGGKIHLGATSMDIVDNAESIRIIEALDLVRSACLELLKLFSAKIIKYKDTVCLGYTHLQPAEPTTVGYRLAFYAQDLLIDFRMLRYIEKQIQVKGFKGAVGTSASYAKLLTGSSMTPYTMEKMVTDELGIKPFIVTSQVSSRKIDYLVLTLLSSIGSTLSKFAADLRILQSPMFGEWSEPFGSSQVGSSAMPYKKNPVSAEKICSLARYLISLPAVVLENASLSHLERTLDDSANRRIIFPTAFLTLDEIVSTAQKILKGLVVNEKRITHNLNVYAPFLATEAVLMESVKKGADRQKMHEILRKLSLKAWEEVITGRPNPLLELMKSDSRILRYIKKENINKVADVSTHTGDAGKRGMTLISQIQKEVISV